MLRTLKRRWVASSSRLATLVSTWQLDSLQLWCVCTLPRRGIGSATRLARALGGAWSASAVVYRSGGSMEQDAAELLRAMQPFMDPHSGAIG
jgi:hypothetical protein